MPIALVNEIGEIEKMLDTLPAEVPKGLQLYCWNADGTKAPPNAKPLIVSEEGSCRGAAMLLPNGSYLTEVVGNDPETVRRITEKLRLAVKTGDRNVV